MAYLQNQQNLEAAQTEEIPLNRIDSTEEPTGEVNLREIFNAYDQNGNNFLDIREMKRLITSKQCGNLPKRLAKNILKVGDTDNDGHLSFEEFYRLSIQHNWFGKRYVTSYCKFIIPPAHRRTFDEPDGQYGNGRFCWPPPITMVVFSLIQILTFLFDVFYFNDHRDLNLEKLGVSTDGPAAVLFIYDPYKRQQVWRFLTYMFVHVGVIHLVMNLIVQIFLGVTLEMFHSWWRVSLVYLAGVVAGSMGTSISDPTIFLAGASGGVYALITAHIATIIINWKEIGSVIASAQLFIFLIFCVTDLGTSIYNYLNSENQQIGYIAHLSGAIAGLLVGIAVLENVNVRPWEKSLWWIAITVYFVIMFIIICIHIFVPQHFPMPITM